MLARPSREALTADGVRARARRPIGDHAVWKPSAARADPIDLLEEQAPTRVPELVPVRYGRMAASPFAFLRGAALPMASDLAADPTTGIQVQLCGDAHLSNFGLFASPERTLLFDINDFDETLAGPFEWDVKRLAASIVVAGRSRGFDGHANRHAVHRAVRSYRAHVAPYATMRAIDIYYSAVDATAILAFAQKRAQPFLKSTVRSAAHHDALHELPKLTEVVGGHRSIVDRPPLIVHQPEITTTFMSTFLAAYRATLEEDRQWLLDRYELVDAAMKVVGVGSVGLGAFIALFDGGSDDDPLFLQIKQAEASVLERFLGESQFSTHGERVVAGQRRLQAQSDILLGHAVGELAGRHWYVRQLQDMKAGAVVEAMTQDDLVAWGELCGWALARGHARSGEPATIAGYLGGDDAFDQAIAHFAEAYADQTERDHAAFLAAIKGGRIHAESSA